MIKGREGNGQCLREERDDAHGAAEVGHECHDGDDGQDDMFLCIGPIERVVRIGGWLGDEDGLAVGGGLEIRVGELGCVQHVSAMISSFVNEGIVFGLLADGDWRGFLVPSFLDIGIGLRVRI